MNNKTNFISTESIDNIIIKLFNNGETYKKISEVTGCPKSSVRKELYRLKLIDLDPPYGLTNEEFKDVKEHYKNGDKEYIYNTYPVFSKNKLYHIASLYGFYQEEYFWHDDEIKYLINNYGKVPYDEMIKVFNNRHNKKAICAKAIQLGLTIPQEWTDNELNILKKYYSILPKNEFKKLLPNRSEDAIICKAMKLKIKSYQYLHEKYTSEEKQFIINNFGILTDDEIAKKINKTKKGVRDQRISMKLLYAKKDFSKYENLSKVFRGHIQDWKNKSMNACNYKCIFTNSKNFIIHHIVGFNVILAELYEKLESENILKSIYVEDYDKETINYMINEFIKIHNKYPLGVCIRYDIHDLFHSIYGAGGNTQEQWNAFVAKYNNHEFDDKYYIDN